LMLNLNHFKSMTQSQQSHHTPNQIYDTIGEMVDEAMESLRNDMEQYESPTLLTAGGKPKRGISALALDIGVDRTNITNIFSDRTNQQMSTWLFIKICQHLNIWPAGWEYHPTKDQERQSVKVAMMTPRDPMMVCLAGLLSRA
jgi:DNA-binding phage protein